MGRSAGPPLKVNTKKMDKSRQGECMEELQGFFGCMTVRLPLQRHWVHWRTCMRSRCADLQKLVVDVSSLCFAARGRRFR